MRPHNGAESSDCSYVHNYGLAAIERRRLDATQIVSYISHTRGDCEIVNLNQWRLQHGR